MPLSGWYNAPLTCPSCGHKFIGRWDETPDEREHPCPSCGHVQVAAWPGWHFEPEIVIVERDCDEYRDAVRKAAATCPPFTEDQKAEIRAQILKARNQP